MKNKAIKVTFKFYTGTGDYCLTKIVGAALIETTEPGKRTVTTRIGDRLSEKEIKDLANRQDLEVTVM